MQMPTPRRHDLGQTDQHAAFVEAAPVLELGLVYRQPDQRCGAAVLGDQGKHDGGLVISVEVGPVHGTSREVRAPITNGTQSARI
jgi:hypothetical protein